MKPSRPDVVSGVEVRRKRGQDRPASVEALTSLPVAKPGCTSTPWITRSAPAAVNVSSCNSPADEPSSVYAQAAPKRSMSNSDAPCPTSSSGVSRLAIAASG